MEVTSAEAWPDLIRHLKQTPSVMGLERERERDGGGGELRKNKH